MYTTTSVLGPILITISLVIIFAIILSIGWTINRQRSQSIGQLPRLLKEKYNNGEISKKEYEDVKREIEEPLHQLKYYLKVYK